MDSSKKNSINEYLVSSMEELLENGKYSDLTIRCQGHVFKVHCAMVCTRSKVLAAAVDGQFKEAITREIDLEEDEPSIIGHLLDFLYHGDYDDGVDASTPENAQGSDHSASMNSGPSTSSRKLDDPLLINTKVYIAAEKYNILPLKSLATAKYRHAVVNLWHSPTFSESADLLYENSVESDTDLRDAIAQTAKNNITFLLRHQEFVTVLKDHSDFSIDVIKLMAGRDYSGGEIENGSSVDVSFDVADDLEGWGFGRSGTKKKRRSKLVSPWVPYLNV